MGTVVEVRTRRMSFDPENTLCHYFVLGSHGHRVQCENPATGFALTEDIEGPSMSPVCEPCGGDTFNYGEQIGNERVLTATRTNYKTDRDVTQFSDIRVLPSQ